LPVGGTGLGGGLCIVTDLTNILAAYTKLFPSDRRCVVCVLLCVARDGQITGIFVIELQIRDCAITSYKLQWKLNYITELQKIQLLRTSVCRQC